MEVEADGEVGAYNGLRRAKVKVCTMNPCKSIMRLVVLPLALWGSFGFCDIRSEPPNDADDGELVVYSQFLSIINAKSPAELRQGMERLKNITLRQKAFLFLLCSDAAPKYLSGTLPWNGGSIEGFDVKKRSARCLLLLSHVLGEKTVPITHEMNASQEGAVLNRFRKQCIEMLNNAEERHVEERMRFLTTNLPRLSRAEKMKAVEDEEIYAFPLLIHDPDVEIRKAVARCSNTPFSLLLQMRKDPDPLVAQLANRNFITARGMETVIEKTWFGRIVMKFALSDTVREARDVWQQITNLSESRQYKVCLWLASQLDDLRYSPALGGPPPEGAHDLSLVGGKSAWLLEHLLGKMLIPVTGNTPKDVLERQKRRVVSLVQARFSPEKSSK